jgi:hypothetical protein
MMHDLDPETRRNLHYAALPGKVASSFVVLILCLVVGLFGTALALYLFGFLVRHFGGGF